MKCKRAKGDDIMKTLFAAVAGALALGAVLVSYDLGERHTFSRDIMGDPYLVQAGQMGYPSPYERFAGQPYGVVTPGGYAAPQYVNERVAATQPVVRRTSTQRTYVSDENVARERVAPQRTWQKSALLIAGSAAGGAGVGALVGGKKGAGIGALIGGGSAALYDQVKRH